MISRESFIWFWKRFRSTETETWKTLYLEVWIFENIIGAIVIFAEVHKTRRWKMVWNKIWLNSSIGGLSTKKANVNGQVLICWSNMQRELKPATSSLALSIVFGTGLIVVQTLESWQTRKMSTRGGAEFWKKIYIPGFGVWIGRKEWDLDVKGNPSRVFLGFALPSPRLRGCIE